MGEQQAVVAAVGGRRPRLADSAYTAPTSVVVGEVAMGESTGLWYGAVLRGDTAPVSIGAGSNIQDNSTVHADPGFPVTVGEHVSVGHNAVLHGCTVEDEVLVGMGATVLNGARIGAGSLVAAQALVPQGMQVPPGSLVAGVPAKVKRELTEEEREGVRLNAAVYLDLAEAHRGAEPVDGRAQGGGSHDEAAPEQ